MLSRTRYRMSFGLGLLSAVAIVAAILALEDIYNAEKDVSLEWWVLRISILVVIAFHAVAVPVLRDLSA